jgi:peroxiredoxin
VVVSPQLQASAREPGPLEVSYAMLADAGNQVARRYGVVHALSPELQQIYAKLGVDLPAVNGDGSWTLPMPARFVIDRDGIVRAVDADPDYTRRPEPAETVEALRRLAS